MPNVLLCGNDRELIDNFLYAKDDAIKCTFLSTTDNPNDILHHIDVIKPEVFVYCVQNQDKASLAKIDGVFAKMQEANVKFVLVGDDEEMDALYTRFGANKVNSTLCKEMGIYVVLERISDIANENSDSEPSYAPQAVMADEYMPGQPLAAQPTAQEAEPKRDLVSPSSVFSLTSGVSEDTETKKRILVIDDDANVLRTIKIYLGNEYSVAVATSGPVALKFLEKSHVDIVLLDYMMPIMDGPTVLARIRSIVDLRNVPVVFLSGVSDREKIRQILASNVQGYLLKPVDNVKLHNAIKKALGEEQ